ncbi:MAG: ABC transporter permease subunit, partial [Hyphomicrobiaceae bacterium]|nr:ABC transporter permease subunit [Hyphomicrobiaceae bacterium]
LPVFAVIAYASAQVDVALVLGPTTPPPFSLRILEWAQDPDLGQRQVAAAAALVQLALTAFAGLCWMAGERLMAALWRRAAMSGRRFHRDGGLRALALGLGLLPVLSVGGGLLALALWSVSGPWRFPEALPVRFTLAAWQRFAASLDESLVPTLLIAGLASMAALVLVVLCLAFETTRGMKSLSSRGLVVLYLPLLVPQVAFLFGLQILAIVLHLDGTLLGVAAVHLLFVLPYVYLSLAGPWRRVDPRFDTTAASLGLTPLRRLLRVRLPLLTAPLLTAFAIGLAVSIGQYLPTLMIGAGRIQTITTETLALSSGGDRRLLGAAALLQALLPFLGFALALVLPGLLFRNRRGMTA